MGDREVLKFRPKEARDVLWECDDDFKIIETEIVDQSGWSIHKSCVLQRKSDSKFFIVDYSEGATENQHEEPFEYEDEVEFHEVVPVERTIVTYDWPGKK